MEKKYTLPEVEKLKELGLNFEFNTLINALRDIKKFVKQNKRELIELFFPDLNADNYLAIRKVRNCDDNIFVQKTIAAKLRITKGKIQTGDYMYIVPPCLKENKSVLLKVHQKRLETYMIDSGLAFYDCTYLGIGRNKAIKKVLFNEVLRLIIENFSPHGIGAVKKDSRLKKIANLTDSIRALQDKAKQYGLKGRQISAIGTFQQINKLEYEKYELLFAKRLSIRQKAHRTLERIKYYPVTDLYPKYTSIEDKQCVIRQYLRLQTPHVRKSGNTRGSGSNSMKKKLVLSYHSQNPDASISEIARQCKVARKTVRKYLNE